MLSLQYGRSSWLPVLNCQKELVVKGDHYFVVGMTHKPNLLRLLITACIIIVVFIIIIVVDMFVVIVSGY